MNQFDIPFGTTKCPEPGFYPGVSEAEYRQWNAINQSCLKSLTVSPGLFLDEMIHGRPEPTKEAKEAMDLGTLVHALVLEPDSTERSFVVKPDTYPGKANSSDVKKGLAEKVGDPMEKKWTGNAGYCKDWEEANSGKILVSNTQIAKANEMSRALIGLILPEVVAAGRKEMAIVWDDPKTGLRCKALLDLELDGIVYDLKTFGKRLDGDNFHAAAWKGGYLVQAAHYLSGVNVLRDAAGKKPKELQAFRFAVVESARPYRAKMYDLVNSTDSYSYPMLQLGVLDYERKLRWLKYAIDNNSWPMFIARASESIDQPFTPGEVYEDLEMPEWIAHKTGAINE